MKLNVLFFPWSHGVGFGYLARSLTIGAALRMAGAACWFAADTRERHVVREGFALADPEDPYAVAIPDMGSRQGDYIAIDSLNTALAMTRYYRSNRIQAEVDANLRLIEKVQPNLCVTDLSPTAGIAAKIASVPVLSVGDSDYFRAESAAWMPWVDPALIRRPYPSCVPAFNEVLGGLGLPGIDDVSDLLWGDRTWIASTPWLEEGQPLLTVRGRYQFVGPIEWTPSDPPRQAIPLTDFGSPGRRVYVSLGHGGKFTAAQLRVIADGCTSAGWSCYIGAGFRPPDGWDALPEGVRFGGFHGLDSALTWSDVVLNHGGYTTVLASLRTGKPSIVLPFMSEQEANAVNFVEGKAAGFRLRELELGRPPEYLRYRHRYRNTSLDPGIAADDVVAALEEVSSTDYQQGAARAATDITSVVEGRDLVSLVEEMMR